MNGFITTINRCDISLIFDEIKIAKITFLLKSEMIQNLENRKLFVSDETAKSLSKISRITHLSRERRVHISV